MSAHGAGVFPAPRASMLTTRLKARAVAAAHGGWHCPRRRLPESAWKSLLPWSEPEATSWLFLAGVLARFALQSIACCWPRARGFGDTRQGGCGSKIVAGSLVIRPTRRQFHSSHRAGGTAPGTRLVPRSKRLLSLSLFCFARAGRLDGRPALSAQIGTHHEEHCRSQQVARQTIVQRARLVPFRAIDARPLQKEDESLLPLPLPLPSCPPCSPGSSLQPFPLTPLPLSPALCQALSPERPVQEVATCVRWCFSANTHLRLACTCLHAEGRDGPQ